MAITSTYLGTFGGGTPEWTSRNISGRGTSTTIFSTSSGRMAVVELRSSGSNREVVFTVPGLRRTLTLQTPGTYYQVMEPNTTMAMVSSVTFVRSMEFNV